jgi:serine/threonine protein phosphatase PrpC
VPQANTSEDGLNIETGQSSLIGDREVNQDRASIVFSDTQALLVVADGMGGHSDGEVAAQVTVEELVKAFKGRKGDGGSGADFLRRGVADAHRAVVAAGASRPLDSRPRTTCTVCLIEDGKAVWAHVGDSRVYLFREGALLSRTRDHSAVEQLYQAGKITQEEMLTHPMRNFVEQCIGGEAALPEISVGEPVALEPGDVVMLCSDGFWAPLDEKLVAGILEEGGDLTATLEDLAEQAVEAAHPYADNATAAALRWLADEPESDIPDFPE